LGVKSAREASVMMDVAYSGNVGTINNLVYEAHGGLDDVTKQNFFKTRIEDGGEWRMDNVITSDVIGTYMDNGKNSRVAAVQNMMCYVAEGGNFIFNTCNTLEGDSGNKLLISLARLSGNRINITGATGFVVHSGYKGSLSKGLDVEGNLNANNANS
jgi:hypothetical protein